MGKLEVELKENKEISASLRRALVTEKWWQDFPDEKQSGIRRELIKILIFDLHRSKADPQLQEVGLAVAEEKLDLELNRELKEALAELEFNSLNSNLNSAEDPGRSRSFLALSAQAQVSQEVADKALFNSIALAPFGEMKEACEAFQKRYGRKILRSDPAYKRCLRAAEETYDLSQIYFWKTHPLEKPSRAEILSLRLIEKGLGKKTLIKDQAGDWKRIEALWVKYDGSPHLKMTVSSKIKTLEATLKPVKVSELEKLVPRKIASWQGLDEFFKLQIEKASGIEEKLEALRSRIVAAEKIKDFMAQLPQPKFRNAAEKQAYDGDMQKLAEVWSTTLDERKMACGRTAYRLQPLLKEDAAWSCPIEIQESDLKMDLENWRREALNQNAFSLPENVQKALAKATSATNVNEAKYWALWSLDFLKEPTQQARALRVLVEKNKSARALEESLILAPYDEEILRTALGSGLLNSYYQKLIELKLQNGSPTVSTGQESSVPATLQ